MLRTAREQLGTYRQVLLKHAVDGKITVQWREENSGAEIERQKTSLAVP